MQLVDKTSQPNQVQAVLFASEHVTTSHCDPKMPDRFIRSFCNEFAAQNLASEPIVRP